MLLLSLLLLLLFWLQVKSDPAVVASVLRMLFEEPLKAVKSSAQKKVHVPDGLDLDERIYPAAKDEDTDIATGRTKFHTHTYTHIHTRALARARTLRAHVIVCVLPLPRTPCD